MAKLAGDLADKGLMMNQMTWKKPSSVLSKLLFPQMLPSLLPVLQTANACSFARALAAATRKRLQRECTLQITVRSSEDVTRLRHVLMQSCGTDVGLMRLSPLEHARKMRLSLCVLTDAVPYIMDVVMHAVPQAEFGLRRPEPSGKQASC